MRMRAPELKGGFKWLNSVPLEMHELRGKVVLVDFWTYTCVNCLRTLPFLKEWHKRYHDKGLEIIGVHTPEFTFEKDESNVLRFVTQEKIEYPVVLDNFREIWNRFANRYWPAKYLVDKNGYIRFTHFGEGDYAKVERLIQKLLVEANSSLQLGEVSEMAQKARKEKVCYPVTPETYTGFARGLPANTKHAFDAPFHFEDSAEHLLNRFYLQGEFDVKPAFVRHARETSDFEDYLLLVFKSFEVNVVMKASEAEKFPVYLELDGQPVDEQVKGSHVEYDENGRSYVPVTEPKMYNLISNLDLEAHTLKMSCNSPQWETYAFTFGTCRIQKAA